ncbi:MAG: TIGR00282 family metallophosphoesterase [Rhizobiales bacterium]|nr:TIGR00282 family metallophosphoesterase [Hyphomicrobiales bacterium]
MRLLFLGDIVGRSGRSLVIERLPELRRRHAIDFAVVNGENAAGGFGITEQIYHDLLDAGADVVTTGNHVWDQKETLVFIERSDRLLRPLNFPAGTPGKGAGVYRAANGADILVMNAMGRVFMADLDCPFVAVDTTLEGCSLGQGCDVAILDFHTEASSETQAMGFHVDGRASLVVGTHTHVPTADERVLPAGTAYITDVGMCGDYNSVVGMEREESVNRFLTKIARERFRPATGPATIAGVIVDVDEGSGLAKDIQPLRLGGSLRSAEPLGVE